ncbi:MAG TPA: YifB family Mg chelatase-like AAA ATPase [Solirubrobacterales bacterium]|nr:YifB family Mg chelatase-like AAA ATPase [Solirubrobacterales bacterium]
MLAETTAFTIDGISARPVRVEVDVQRGLPNFQIVGLPDTAVREARERVRAALVNCGFEFPLKRITANLAPADLRKVGPGLDLALAAALLGAAGEIPADRLDGWAFAGELALDGTLRPVRGALAMAEAARAYGNTGIVVPPANGGEAALAHGVDVRTIAGAAELRQLSEGVFPGERPVPVDLSRGSSLPDMRDLRGQDHFRRALEISAAGGHGLLVIGPPGAGKSLGARRVASILPPLGADEALEVARIASVSGGGLSAISGVRPFRAPHHTVTPAGLVGGGTPPRPGEITLAHRGVLFLDEICEFRRSSLEALREPMETGEVNIVRAGGRQTLPCAFTLVAAANPCPCGRGEEDPACDCNPAAVRRYRAVLSGALADRIDINLAVRQPGAEAMSGPPGEASAEIRGRVIAARFTMEERYGSARTNATATAAEVAGFETDADAARLLSQAHSTGRMSGRAHDRTLRVARTIADLEDAARIGEDHMAAALQMRRREA